MPLERLDGLVSNVWFGYQEQNNQNYHGTALQVCVIVSMALICVTRTMATASITHCQQPLSPMLRLEVILLPYGSISRTSLKVARNLSQIQRRAILMDASISTFPRGYDRIKKF